LVFSVEHGGMEHLDENPRAASIAFGQRLRELRAEHGLSQDDLADKTDVHPTAIGRLERGSREPRLTTILRIARGLDVSPGALLDELRSH
jgi:transcriptional regulator with XRE-family HTH domain